MPVPKKLQEEFEKQPELPAGPKPQVRSPRAHGGVQFADLQPAEPSSPRPGNRGPRAGAGVTTITRSGTVESIDSQPDRPNYHTSQACFKEQQQTAIVFDFDDTLFPTTFVDNLSSSYDEGNLKANELKEFLAKIEECQATAESLLGSAQDLGHVIIVTLCSRKLLEKRVETWYPRVWKLMKNSRVVYGRESELHVEESKKQSEEDHSTGYWAWVKGSVIEQELHSFYSQYKGQSWKNVISIGDSNIERYGTLGATNAYVQKNFSKKGRAHAMITQRGAYGDIWENFDSKNSKWREGLEGIHKGHVFKVRTKVVKMLEEPTPAELCRQQKLLSLWFSTIVNFDGSLNLLLDDLRNVKAVKELEKGPMILTKSGSIDDDQQLAIVSRMDSSSLAFTGLGKACTKDSL